MITLLTPKIEKLLLWSLRKTGEHIIAGVILTWMLLIAPAARAYKRYRV